ncbi:MAG TPA: hypothetical protein VM098_01320, partial [Phycisphaerae bacterium]|nr:hypothetical protein [Phycisphaerae bacterium]
VRSRSIYARMPFVVVHKSRELRVMAEQDDKLLLVDPELKDDKLQAELRKTAAEAMRRGVGRPLTAEEATTWSVTAADAIRKLGETGNNIFDVSVTQTALIESVGDIREPVQLAAARALAVMDTADAQRAIAGLATGKAARTGAQVEAFADLSESIRRFGNKLADEQVKVITAIVTGKDEMSLREAAAEALGAMNLPSQEIIPLIKTTGD